MSLNVARVLILSFFCVQKKVPPFGNKPVGVADAWPNTQAIVFGIQAGASFLCFLVCKFACKICIQVRTQKSSVSGSKRRQDESL